MEKVRGRGSGRRGGGVEPVMKRGGDVRGEKGFLPDGAILEIDRRRRGWTEGLGDGLIGRWFDSRIGWLEDAV